MQKYQVFIDEHLISIVDKVKRNQQFDTFMELHSPNVEEIEILVNYLYEEKSEVVQLSLVDDKPEKVWNEINVYFKLIEAAGGLVENTKGEILFIERLGKWDLPKGKLEKGEMAEEAAIREVEEECGISSLQLGKQLDPTYHMYWHKDQYVLKKTHWYLMNYEGNEQLKPQVEEGIEEVCWMSKDKLHIPLKNTYASLVNMIEKAAKR